jgi:hypothetical protein
MSTSGADRFDPGSTHAATASVVAPGSKSARAADIAPTARAAAAMNVLRTIVQL